LLQTIICVEIVEMSLRIVVRIFIKAIYEIGSGSFDS